MALWGIDLGGTKIEGVIMAGTESTDVHGRLRVPTEQEGGYDHILQQIAKLVQHLQAESGLKPQKIGIGHPGATDPKTGLMKNSNTTCLNGKPFYKDLASVLGVEVSGANDANCFAIAEYQYGVVRQQMPEAKTVFGIIMGTGVGGGLIANGQLVHGLHGIGGEWGHNFLHESGGPCYCGRTGCVETIISGTGLQRYYRQIAGESKTLRQIVADQQADSHADATLNRLLEYFGKAAAYLVNIIDPDAIIIGGGVGNIDLLYTRGREELAKHVFNPTLETRLLKPSLGDSAGVFGAALLVA